MLLKSKRTTERRTVFFFKIAKHFSVSQNSQNARRYQSILCADQSILGALPSPIYRTSCVLEPCRTCRVPLRHPHSLLSEQVLCMLLCRDHQYESLSLTSSLLYQSFSKLSLQVGFARSNLQRPNHPPLCSTAGTTASPDWLDSRPFLNVQARYRQHLFYFY
jgi:hypothetical protein